MAEPKASLFDPDDFRPVLKFVGKNWYILLLLPMVGFIGARYYTYQLNDIYAAKTEILLRSKDSYDYQSQLYSNFGYYSLMADVTNQQRVLSSYDIISKTIDKLNFGVSYYLVGRVKVEPVTKIEALDIDVQLVDQQLYNKPLDIQIVDLDRYSLSYDYQGDRVTKTYRFGERVEDVNYILTIDKSGLVDEGNLETLQQLTYQFQVHPHDWLVKKFSGALAIQNVEYTSILNIVVRDVLPARAKVFLDTLSSVYIDYTQESRVEVNENTQKYIDTQLLELEEILDSLEYTLQNFRNQKRILDLSREKEEYFESMVALDTEKRKLELRIESMNTMEEFLRGEMNSTSLPPSFFMFDEDNILQNQVSQLYNLQLERSGKLNLYEPENYRIQSLDSLIKVTKIGIFNYTKDTRNAMLARIQDIDKQIRQLEGKLKNIPKSQRDILGIDRKIKVNEELYVFLLEKKASTVIARAAIVPEASVVEEARVVGVVGPDKQRSIYLSTGVGLIFAVLIGLVRFLFFTHLENVQELKRLTNLPVIGGVPFYEEILLEPIAILGSSRSNVSEAFRSLRANLQYLLRDEGPKVLLVTSLHPGEGKTFTSTNLAAVLAKAGKKVILLDFDMHKPRVHNTFGLDNVSGISTFIIGKTDLNECKVQSQVENLDIVTAGPVPPNASELVVNKKVDELIERLKAEYDYVILDTPPLILISDSLVLMRVADTGLYVMNTEKASRQGVRYLEEVLEQNKIGHVALLLNNIKQKKWKYYYGKYLYRYGYSYAYGYGYGYGYGYEYGYGNEGYGPDPDERKPARNGKRKKND